MSLGTQNCMLAKPVSQVVKVILTLKFLHHLILMFSEKKLLSWNETKTFFQVRYLKKEFAFRKYPDTATELFQRESVFRDYNNSLDQVGSHD